MTLARVRALPRPLAFVLPGGGALGAYQVGVLRALAEADVVPDLLIGVSAGAVNAALYSWNGSIDGVARIDHVWRSIRRRDLLRINPGRVAMAMSGRRSSFLDNRHGEAFLRRHLGFRRLEDAPIPLVVVATGVVDGRPVALTSGDAATAVLASTAFPGVYPPVEIDGRLLMDGGVTADIPLDTAMAVGARGVLVLSVPPLAPGKPTMRAIDLLFRASTFGVEAHGRTTLARPPAGLEVVDLSAPPSPVTTFAVGRTDGIADQGHRAAIAWLAGETATDS